MTTAYLRVTMTILVKANTAGKKAAGVAVLPLVGQRQVKRIHMHTRYAYKIKPSTGAFLFLSMISLAVVILGFTSGVLLFREYLRTSTLRYRGSCAISSTKDMDYIVLNDAPAKQWLGMPAAQMKVYSSASDLINSRIMSQLLEDMAIEDRMETITVHDGERAFEIVHDFDDNLTSIRSEERCFLMDMCRDFVLDPSSLIASFHNESKLDLSHAHTFFRAELPAISVAILSNVGVTRSCIKSNRPIYHLNLEDTLVLRKRSVAIRTTMPPAAVTLANPSADQHTGTEGPKQDFVHFSGKHLQRITISNMDDILSYELANSIKNVHPKLRAGVVTKK